MSKKDHMTVVLEDVNQKFATILEYVSDIPKMKEDIAELKTDVSGLKTDVSSLKIGLFEVQGTLEEHTTELKFIRSDLQNFNQILDRHETDIQELKVKVA